MSEYLEKIVYLSQADYNTLLNGGSITRNGITLDSLEDNYLYITDGTISSTDISGVIPISKGGTNASTASDARLNLGLGDAATKSVVTSISTSTNLPTSTAVKTYVDNSVATRIPTTGTAGDILYWSAADTPAHLAKGSNGKVLKLANGLPTWGDAGTVTSVQVQASSPLQSSTSTAQSSTLNTTISFTNQNANVVLAGPSSGSSAAAPTFRSLVAADIPDLAWSKITSGKPTTLSGYGITDAAASDHTQAVNKGGTNITSYTIGDMLYASASTTLSKLAGNTTTTAKYLKSVATTSGTAVAPVWAQIAASEISGLGTMATANTGDYATSGHTQAVNKGGTNITSYTIGDILYASAATTLSKLSGNTTTTVKFLKSVATTSGTAVAPAWAQITASDISGLGTMATANTGDYATSGHTQAVNKGGTNITSYTIGDLLYASASTTLSKLAGNTTTTVKYLKSVATTSGTAIAPAWAQIAASEISGLGAAATKAVTDNSSNADVTSTDTNLITGRTLYYQLAKKGYTTNTGTVTSVTLTSGSGITVSDSGTAITGSGSRTISITGMDTTSGSTSKCLTEKGTWASFSNNSGTVTSVTLTQGAGITVSDSGTAITGSGSRTISITGMNTSSGSTAKCLTEKGTWASFTNNAGTVTSVQVQASSPLQSSTSTAQSASLSTTISFSNQDPNKVLAGPSSGSSAAAPTFRALVAADIPNLSWNKITSDKPTTLSGYGITDAVSSSALNDYVLKAGDTMTGTLIANNYCTKWGYEYLNSSNVNVGGFYIDTYNDNNQFYIDEYTAGGVTSGVRECYLLPSPTATVATWYNILTDKNAVTIAQGGTGATTAADARTNLGLGSMATANTGDYLALAGGTMTGTITLNNGVAMNTASEAGWSMNQYGNLTHRRTNSSDYLGIVGSNGDPIRFYYDTGESKASTMTCTTSQPQCIELKGMASGAGHGGYIDFHYNNSAADYTSRIIESASGTLAVSGKLTVGGNLVFTKGNFSLSGTTLTITPPS